MIIAAGCGRSQAVYITAVTLLLDENDDVRKV